MLVLHSTSPLASLQSSRVSSNIISKSNAEEFQNLKSSVGPSLYLEISNS
jgi:hypothetical protein